MKPMTYKGYSARIEYSDEDDCFIGRLAGIRDIITFHGNFVEEVRHAFQEAVDFYLETCRQRNEAPQKPYSGKISLRISPNIHARMPLVKALISGLLKHWNMPYTLKTIFLTNQYVGGLGHTIWLGKSFCCGRSRSSWR